MRNKKSGYGMFFFFTIDSVLYEFKFLFFLQKCFFSYFKKKKRKDITYEINMEEEEEEMVIISSSLSSSLPSPEETLNEEVSLDLLSPLLSPYVQGLSFSTPAQEEEEEEGHSSTSRVVEYPSLPSFHLNRDNISDEGGQEGEEKTNDSLMDATFLFPQISSWNSNSIEETTSSSSTSLYRRRSSPSSSTTPTHTSVRERDRRTTRPWTRGSSLFSSSSRNGNGNITSTSTSLRERRWRTNRESLPPRVLSPSITTEEVENVNRNGNGIIDDSSVVSSNDRRVTPHRFLSLLSLSVPMCLEHRTSTEFRGERYHQLAEMEKQLYHLFFPHLMTLTCPICRDIQTDRVLICVNGHSICRTCFDYQSTQSHILEKNCCLCRKPWIYHAGISLREWKPILEEIIHVIDRVHPWKLHQWVDVQLINMTPPVWMPGQIIYQEIEDESVMIRIGQKWTVEKNIFSDEIQRKGTHTQDWVSCITQYEQTIVAMDRRRHLRPLSENDEFCFDMYLEDCQQWVLASTLFYDTEKQKWFYVYYHPTKLEYDVSCCYFLDMVKEDKFYFHHTLTKIEQHVCSLTSSSSS